MKRLMLYIIMVCASCTRTGVAAPEMTVTGTENRGNYECRSVEFDVGNDERIKGYLLVPDRAADEKCPAIILLHDHGARFDIGKEKLVRPPAPQNTSQGLPANGQENISTVRISGILSQPSDTSFS